MTLERMLYLDDYCTIMALLSKLTVLFCRSKNCIKSIDCRTWN